MFGGFRQYLIFILALATVLALLPCAVLADVNLEWRSDLPQVVVGDVVDVGLFAVSDSKLDQSLGFLVVILDWDPARLELLGLVPEFDEYAWLQSFFPDDQSLDRINSDCGLDQYCVPYTGAPFNDGSAYYEAWAAFPPAEPPRATPAGSLVTTFRFRALHSGSTTVGFVPFAGDATSTRVLSAEAAATEITGILGADLQLTIGSCTEAPAVEATGSRYLAVTPPPGELPIALRLTGDLKDSASHCVSSYIAADGALTSEPEFLTPAQWGTVHVTAASIVPSTSYLVYVDCGTAGSAELSLPGSATTWAWGDVNGDGLIDSEDVSLVLAATLEDPRGESVFSMDTAGCEPNRIVDADDVIFVLAASQGAAFPCDLPCSIDLELSDLAALLACLDGPQHLVTPACLPFDLDEDNDVDLEDVGSYQNMLSIP